MQKTMQLVKNQLEPQQNYFFDVDGPTELKRYLGANNLDSRITRLWGILNDKRILKYEKSLTD